MELRAGRAGMLATGLVAASLMIAGCSSTGAGTSAAPTSAGGGAVTVSTASGSAGPYLTDASGRALYLWVADTKGTSTCTGACASAWPPLITKGAPHAAGAAKAGELGTTARSGGQMQVTYDGHPLYYFAGDKGPKQTTGQGSDGFGAKWWLVAPTGTAITSTSGSGSSSSSGSNGGGYY